MDGGQSLLVQLRVVMNNNLCSFLENLLLKKQQG